MRSIAEDFVKGRFSLMLTCIFAMFFLAPLAGQDQTVIDRVFGWFGIAVLISCLRAIARTRRFFIFMAFFTVITVLMSGLEILVPSESNNFMLAVLGVKIVHSILVFGSIMRFVLNNGPVNGDKICGAISAYLLMGIIWSFVYTLFYSINPESISVPQALVSSETGNSYWSIYFSFTTLTTLGYGDITPQTPVTQSYAVVQAAIGQIFLGVIVARLIALHITCQREGDAER